MNISTEQMRFWSPEVRELDPYTPGEQPKILNKYVVLKNDYINQVIDIYHL